MPAFHSFIPDRDGWKTLHEEICFSGPYLQVQSVTVTSPTRSAPFNWTVCHRKAAVVVAARTTEGKFILVRQERVPIRATIWELPAGQIDHATEQDAGAIRATGLRELREESGYELMPGGEVVSLGHFFPSCGFTDEHSHLLLVHPVAPGPSGPALDANEMITECRAFSSEELKAMVASGEICDANTLAAFARLTAMDILSGRTIL